jgi:hypothetical protein
VEAVDNIDNDMDIPASVITDIVQAARTTLNSGLPLIAVMLGIPIAFYAVRRFIGLFPKARK